MKRGWILCHDTKSGGNRGKKGFFENYFQLFSIIFGRFLINFGLDLRAGKGAFLAVFGPVDEVKICNKMFQFSEIPYIVKNRKMRIQIRILLFSSM